MSYFDDNEDRLTGLNLGRRMSWGYVPILKEKTQKMQVTINRVDVEWVGEGRKKYGKATVNYAYNGEARRQNVMSFSNPDVFKKVQELTGQTVEVEVGKNDKGYSEWRSVTVGSAPTTSSAAGQTGTTRVSGSNYETKEERAARQVLIVKQSSLSAAVASLSPGAKSALNKEDVLALAQVYADWVFAKPELGGVEEMNDDIPF